MFRVMRVGRSASWVRRSATVLSRGLERARKHGLIDHNPAADAARPKMVRRKPQSPPRDEVPDARPVLTAANRANRFTPKQTFVRTVHSYLRGVADALPAQPGFQSGRR